MALQDILGTGLEGLAQTKLQELTRRTNPLFTQQQPSPAQQTLQSLLNLSPLTPQSQDLLAGLQQLQQTQQPQPDIEVSQEIKTPGKTRKKALEIKPEEPKQLSREEKIERNQLAKRQPAIRKEKKAYLDQLVGYKRVADETELKLQRMDDLIQEGGLPIAGFYKLFKNLEENVNPAYAAAALGGAGTYIGGPIGGAIGAAVGGLLSPVATLLRYGQRLTSPNTEEFEKLSASFINQAKSIFGARITDRDLQEFLKSIPTLEQTDQGKRAIIDNMRIFLKANESKYDAFKSIVDENGGLIPENIEILVEEKVQPDLKKLSSQFKSRLRKESK